MSERIEDLVKRTMEFALANYSTQWEAMVSLIAAARLIALRAGLDWAELVAVVEELVKKLPPAGKPI